jgi:hypothetical protein
MKALIWRPQNGAISERMKDFVSGGRSVSKTILAKSLRRYDHDTGENQCDASTNQFAERIRQISVQARGTSTGGN